MKKIFSFLFAILFAVGTTGVFSSCQEDAPEITINITMNNDFSDVVNAINNGTLKQEAAIAALTAAINGMNGEQNAKMDAIVKAINDLAKTTDAKLAIIEAAMKAQTLALEAKLALLETAIKNIPDYSEKMAAIEAAIKALPDYTNQLKAIEAAIKALPNYTEKLGAIEAAIKALPNYTEKMGALETALKAIAANIEAQEGQYADELEDLTDAIDAIKSEVAAGNTSQEDALAQIIALLKSGAIAGGGGGSGSGGEGEGGEGSGGEGSGDEPSDRYILLTTEKPAGATIQFACYTSQLKGISGAKDLKQKGITTGNYPLYEATLTEQEVKVYGTFTLFYCQGMNLTKINTDMQSSLERINFDNNSKLEFDFTFNTKLEYISLLGVDIEKSEMDKLVKSLPDRSDTEYGTCWVDYDVSDDYDDDANKIGWYIMHKQ